MKRVLLIALVLLLLVSCASSQAKKPEPQASQTTIESAEVVESADAVTPAETTEATESPQETVEQESQQLPEEVVEAVSEEAAVPVVSEEPEAVDNNEQVIVEQEVASIEPAEAEIEKASVEEAVPADGQDWGQVIGSAPTAEAETEKPAETVAAVPKTATEAKTEVARAEKVQSTSVTPDKASFVDRLTSFVKRVGNFIAHQILMSIGFLVCFIGLIYLFIALIINARRTRERDRYASRKQRTDNGASDSFRPGSDEDPETDDAFLRSLLGDDND